MINVFKVGVHIGMTTNSGQVLSIMLQQLTGLHIAANKLNSGLNSVKSAAIGAGAVFAGWAVIKGLVDATKHAEKLNHELVKLQTGARLTDVQTAQASRLAFKTSRDVPGTEAHENVKMTRELFGVFGNMDEARRLMPIVAEGSQAVRNFTDKQGVDLAQVAMKTLELRGHMTKDGKVDEKEFIAEFGSMVRSIVASEGLVDPQKLYMAVKQAGPAARTMSADEFWGKFPAIINAMGAGPAGTALNSFFKQFIGHTVGGVKVAEDMQAAGMLTPGKWHVDKRTHKVVMDQDAVPDQAGAMDHPITWLHEKLEALRKQKGKNGKPIDMLGVIQRIFQFASRATTARFINDVDANYAVIENENERYKRMPGPHEIAKEQNEKDLSVNIKNLNAAWDNFMTALGQPGIPVAISVLHGMTDALNWLQASIERHPRIASDLFYIAGGIGALTALSGGIAVFTAVITPLAGGLALLAGVNGLGVAATGLMAVSGALAVLAGLFTAGGVLAYMGGKWAKENLPESVTGAQDAASNLKYRMSHGGMPKWADNSAPAIPLPPGQNSKPVQLQGNVMLDGRKVGSIVAEGVADRMSKPPTGGNSPDGRVTPFMPGMLGIGGF